MDAEKRKVVPEDPFANITAVVGSSMDGFDARSYTLSQRGESMKALTLWPEWAWAILYLGKRIENRTRPLPMGMLGKPVALHAGKYIGGRPGAFGLDGGLEAVACMARRAGWTAQTFGQYGKRVMKLTKDGVTVRTDETPILTSAIVGVMNFDASMMPYVGDLDCWQVDGQHGWRLSSAEALRSPVSCNGALGFWQVPAPALSAIHAQRGGR